MLATWFGQTLVGKTKPTFVTVGRVKRNWQLSRQQVGSIWVCVACFEPGSKRRLWLWLGDEIV